MKVTSYAVARPNYYDRNATPQTNESSVTVGPHNFTTRYTVTIAAGKKAILEFGYVSLQRATVAATASNYVGAVLCVSSSINIRAPFLEATSNVALAQVSLAFPLNLTIYAGERIESLTADFSTGGTVFYTLQSKATIYDA